MALIARGRQRDVLAATMIGSVVAVVLDVALIPRYGMMGAAAVTVFCELLRTVLVFRPLRALGLGWPPPARFWRPALATVLMSLAVWAAGGRHVLVVIGAGAMVYGLALLASGAVRVRPVRVRL
jgi:O-antigen/teichoic acid export membrane protein